MKFLYYQCQQKFGDEQRKKQSLDDEIFAWKLKEADTWVWSQLTNWMSYFLPSVHNHSFLPEKVKNDKDFDNNGEVDKELQNNLHLETDEQSSPGQDKGLSVAAWRDIEDFLDWSAPPTCPLPLHKSTIQHLSSW